MADDVQYLRNEKGKIEMMPLIGWHTESFGYLFTPLGESLRPILEYLIAWGAHHAEEFDELPRLLPCDAVVRDRTT